MEPYIIVYLIPLTLFASLIYFILIRQNSFEKRVAQYTPRHRLPQKRQVHIQQQKRQLKQYRLMFPLIGVGMILYFGYLHVLLSNKNINIAADGITNAILPSTHL